MSRKASVTQNQIREMRLIREKDDAVNEVTVTFSPRSAPLAVTDNQGNPQIEGGNYEIKRLLLFSPKMCEHRYARTWTRVISTNWIRVSRDFD